MQCSRDSLRRFLTIFLGIDPSHFGYHQTLTFGRDVSQREAKDLLNRLFRKLGRRKAYRNMTAIYIQERQPSNGHLHFHVRLMFFGEQSPFPSLLMKRKFGAVVFNAWNELNGGRLNRCANELREQPHKLHYLIKDIDVLSAKRKLARDKTVWWGRWNWKILRKHYSSPCKELIAATLRKHVGRYKLTESKSWHGRGWLARERRAVEWAGKMGWETHKRLATRRKVKVSDSDFLDFMNGWNPWRKRPARISRGVSAAISDIRGEADEEIL